MQLGSTLSFLAHPLHCLSKTPQTYSCFCCSCQQVQYEVAAVKVNQEGFKKPVNASLNFCCCVAATCGSSYHRVQIPSVPRSCQSSACLKHLTFQRTHVMCKSGPKTPVRSSVSRLAPSPETINTNQMYLIIPRVTIVEVDEGTDVTAVGLMS